MGRKKLSIGLRENLSQRKSTFQKRQAGLIKKISELSTLCGITAGIVIISANGEPTVYSSGDRFQEILDLLNQITPQIKRNLWTGAQYPEEELPKTKKKVSKKRKKRPALSDDEDSSSEGTVDTPHWTPEDTDWDCDLTFLEPLDAAAAAVNVTQALPSVVHQFANAFDDLTDRDWTPKTGVPSSETLEAAVNERQALPSTEQFASYAFNDLPLPSIDQFPNEVEDLSESDPDWPPETDFLFPELLEAVNVRQVLPSISHQFANGFIDFPRPDPDWTPNIDNEWHRDQIYEVIAVNVTETALPLYDRCIG